MPWIIRYFLPNIKAEYNMLAPPSPIVLYCISISWPSSCSLFIVVCTISTKVLLSVEDLIT